MYAIRVERTVRSAQLAEELGVSAATVQRYARLGLIPYVTTVGGHRRFDLDEVRAALATLGRATEVPLSKAPVARRSCTAVVLTALGLEMAAVLEHIPGSTGRQISTGTRYQVGSIAGNDIDWTVCAAEIGEGNIGAAVEVSAAINELKPGIVLFVGVAGGLKPDLLHGSVVVASRVYNYMSGKSGDEFLARPTSFPIWHSLDQLVRQVRRTRWTETEPKPSVELRPIAAGERVVASPASHDFEILAKYYNDAVAVDMESGGLYLAADRFERTAALAVRGISDLVADKTATSDANWQPVAAANAAAFTFALLRAVGPADLRLGPVPVLYATEQSELLGSVPPPARVAIERAESRNPGAALELLQLLASPERSPTEVLAEALSTASPISGLTDPDLWVAVGEFAIAHADNRAGATGFDRAATLAGPEATHLRARAAMAYANDGQEARAADELQRARSGAITPDPFLDVVEAALANDGPRVIATAKASSIDDPLVDLMLVGALEAAGALDEAIETARRSLARAPNRGMTGGLALTTAKLLFRRAQQGDASTITARDLQDAQELALFVRDLRRSWRGPSSEASCVAAASAMWAGDREGALRIALAPPEGSATPEEATDPELTTLAANISMALGDLARARRLAATIRDPVQRLLVQIDCDVAEGIATADARRQLVAVIPRAEPPVRFRAFLQLVKLGEWPLPDLSLLDDPEASQIVLAESELQRGQIDDGIRRLRALGTARGRAFLIEAYLSASKLSEAVDALRDGAERFGEPRYLLQAASLLTHAGKLEQAKVEAERALGLVPATSHLGGQLRLLLIEVSSRLRNWTAVIAHANAAISDGYDSAQLRWAIVWAQFSRRDIPAALAAWRAGTLQPRNDDEAILITQLLRSAPHDEFTAIQLLNLAEEHQESEPVSAAAFAAFFEVSRQLKLPDEEAKRLHGLTEAFFDRWPKSSLFQRIDVSNMDTLVRYLRDHLSGAAKLLDEVGRKVEMSEFPYGMLAAAARRSVAEALIKNAAGCIPAGQPDPNLAANEDLACRSAQDKTVVVETSALIVAGRTGLERQALAAFFADVHAASATLDDAFIGADALRLRSTSSMGWDLKQDRPILTEVQADQADQWAREAETLLASVRACRIDRVEPEVSDRGDLALQTMLAPVRLAKRLGAPLWTDDRGMRLLAQTEGVTSFGSGSILRALHATGRLDENQLADAFVSLMMHSVVDFNVPDDWVIRVAEQEDWRGEHAALVISRPSYWIQPASALEVYRRALKEAATRDSASLVSWSFGATLGAARSRLPAIQRDTIAAVMLLGFSALEFGPQSLPHLLAGARSAAMVLACDDPLVGASRMLSTSMQQKFGGEVGAGLFAQAISELAPEDRTVAFAILFKKA